MGLVDVRVWNLLVASAVACGGENAPAENSTAPDPEYGDEEECASGCYDEEGYDPVPVGCYADDECLRGEICVDEACVLDPALELPECATPSVTFAAPEMVDSGEVVRIAAVRQVDTTHVVVQENEGVLRVIGQPEPTFFLEAGAIDLDATDLDQDGDRDFVALEPSSLHVFVHGDGAYTEGPVTEIPIASAATFADLDGDGFPDVVLEDYESGVVLRVGRGDGSFGEPDVVADERVCGLAGREDGGGVAFGRVDAAIFVGPGEPLSAWDLPRLDSPVDVHSSCASAFGDFDGDGVVDLFLAQDSLGGIGIRWHGINKAAEAIAWAMPTSGDLAIAADLDGDGDDEAVTRYGDSVLFRDTGTADAPAGCIATIQQPLGSGVALQAAADLDANGRADLIGVGLGVVVAYAQD